MLAFPVFSIAHSQSEQSRQQECDRAEGRCQPVSKSQCQRQAKKRDRLNNVPTLDQQLSRTQAHANLRNVLVVGDGQQKTPFPTETQLPCCPIRPPQ